jgi:BirA family biotin operon repressor/biotin-[acetyl-CoA-carboxylase] ligase
MSTRDALLKLLADGAFHSGTLLGERLGVSRAAVNKAIQALVEDGLDIHRLSGRGYRLGEPFVPLSAEVIRVQLGGAPRLELLEATDSTNQQLLRSLAADESGSVCLAEAQSAGRGRRGRQWLATPYHNILLSIAWRFESGPAGLAGLSLAAGVAVLRALDAFGVPDGRSRHPAPDRDVEVPRAQDAQERPSRGTDTSLCGVGLKWPNDILMDGRKLAGLLVDLRGEAAGPSLAVLGLGLNVYLGAHEAASIDQPWAALREVLPGPVDRNRLAALLVQQLTVMFREFERHGFAAFREEWERRHLYCNQPVLMHAGHEDVSGVVEGIDAHGGLRVRDAAGELRIFHSGEVSLRAAPGAAR